MVGIRPLPRSHSNGLDDIHRTMTRWQYFLLPQAHFVFKAKLKSRVIELINRLGMPQERKAKQKYQCNAYWFVKRAC